MAGAALALSMYNNHATATKEEHGRTVYRVCHETVDGRFNWDKRCSNLRPVSREISFLSRRCSAGSGCRYVVRGHHVYWMEYSSIDGPCLHSGPAFHIPSWMCLITRDQVDWVEERTLYPVTRYSSAFHSLEGVADAHLPVWQRDQLASYAADDTSVYAEGNRLKGVNPQRFSVIFPFGKEERWQVFLVSQRGETTFLNDRVVENIDLHQFHLLNPVQCPGHGLPCTYNKWTPDDFLKDGNWGGILGKVGNDIVFLQQDGGISRFPNMVSSDTFMFASYRRTYLHTRGKFYELEPVDGFRVDATLPPNALSFVPPIPVTSHGMKLVDMNVQYFKGNN